ncbi:hypothetical protein [Acinetobacter sp. YH12252]|uniref:hypothetical protein n=1 Tax=Acinetobacter sp. YH12252 TaxID=2601177 RepID=UPI0015D38DEC|nr:hypothetical protein [Acinetobacter sp. YH12252]
MYNRKFKQNVLTAFLKTIILSPLCWAPLVYAENGVQQLDTIVITANETTPYLSSTVKTEGLGTDRLQKAPASISVITADAIVDQFNLWFECTT